MSDELDLVTACECCQGVTRLVPVLDLNRPGLSTLAARVGTHARFKATMLAEISSKEKLQELGRRTNDDFTIALIDAWAVTLDVLAFYQERILNEGYLRTAVERGSLLELAPLGGKSGLHRSDLCGNGFVQGRIVDVPAGTWPMV